MLIKRAKAAIKAFKEYSDEEKTNGFIGSEYLGLSQEEAQRLHNYRMSEMAERSSMGATLDSLTMPRLPSDDIQWDHGPLSDNAPRYEFNKVKPIKD